MWFFFKSSSQQLFFKKNNKVEDKKKPIRFNSINIKIGSSKLHASCNNIDHMYEWIVITVCAPDVQCTDVILSNRLNVCVSTYAFVQSTFLFCWGHGLWFWQVKQHNHSELVFSLLQPPPISSLLHSLLFPTKLSNSIHQQFPICLLKLAFHYLSTYLSCCWKF